MYAQLLINLFRIQHNLCTTLIGALHSLVRNVTNSVNYVTKLTNINKIQNFALHLKHQEEKTLFSCKVD